MHCSILTFLCLLTACVYATKVDIGGPHGDYTVIAKRNALQPAAVHRRHHKKRASASKCSSSSGSTKSKNKSAASSSSAASSGNGSSSSSSSSSSNSSSGNGGSSSSSSTSSNSGSSNSGSSNSGSSSNSSSTTSASSSSSSSSSSSDSGLLSTISEFLGTNTGIGSWFRTDNSQDDTNGRSWCQLNYQDTWLGFAPDVSTMLSNFGNDVTKAGTAYCGLEAKATNPNNGNTALIYIVDGFDPAWVRTPGSIDLTLGAFKALYGSETSDKDIVIQNLQWELTGNRNSNYAFNAGS